MYSGLENIGDVVNSFVKTSDIQNGIQKSMLFKFWGKIVGKKFAKVTRPVSINNRGELIVACANSMVTSELLLFKNDVMKKMEPYSKSLEIEISDIIFSHKIWREEKNDTYAEEFAKHPSLEPYKNFNPDEIELDESEVLVIRKSIEKNTFASKTQREKMFNAIINDLKYQKYLTACKLKN